MSSVRRPHGRLFQIRGPAAPAQLNTPPASTQTVVWVDASSAENSRKHLHNLTSQKLESFGYIFAADRVGYLQTWLKSSVKFSWCARAPKKTHIFLNTERNGHSRSSKVVDFGTSRSAYVTSYQWSTATVSERSSPKNNRTNPIPSKVWGCSP